MSERDRLKIEFNPLADPEYPFDMVRVFNENRIVTHEYSQTGHVRVTFDPYSNTYVKDDPVVVVDNNGNVVVI